MNAFLIAVSDPKFKLQFNWGSLLGQPDGQSRLGMQDCTQLNLMKRNSAGTSLFGGLGVLREVPEVVIADSLKICWFPSQRQ